MPSASDPGRAAVGRWFAQSLKQAIDEVLDGQRTGRFDINCLEKTEKIYLGAMVEIIVRTEFGLETGMRMDDLEDGHQLDAKFTIKRPGRFRVKP